jgi:hypothetical protein
MSRPFADCYDLALLKRGMFGRQNSSQPVDIMRVTANIKVLRTLPDPSGINIDDLNGDAVQFVYSNCSVFVRYEDIQLPAVVPGAAVAAADAAPGCDDDASDPACAPGCAAPIVATVSLRQPSRTSNRADAPMHFTPFRLPDQLAELTAILNADMPPKRRS